MYTQQMMQQPQQNQLQYLANICYNQVDQSSFNPNLPHGNDLQIAIQPTQWLQNPQAQQLLALAVGKFRLHLQSRSNRSCLHSWAYNQISQNRFQNQIWNQWVDHVAGFLEFLLVVQGQNNTPDGATDKAAMTMFKCYLSTCVAAQPQLMQFVGNDQAAVNDIQKFSQVYGAIMQDIQAYRSGRMMAPQQQMYQQNGQMVSMQQPGMGQLPAIGNTMQYGQQQMVQRAPMQLSSMAVGSQSLSVQPAMAVHSVQGQGSTGMDYGIPAAEPVQQPMAVQPAQPAMTPALNPVESYGVSVAEATAPVIQQPLVPVEELDRPIPTSARDVILDPDYYTPQGVTIDRERPYDYVYSPGGVVTRPAYQVDWQVTRNDTFVYTQMVNPEKFIRFYTKWPDGMVQESIVEMNEMMDYMRHEIDADLRGAAYKPDGEVRVTALKVSTEINNMLPIEQVKELQLVDETQPVKMTVDFQGTTDMENEVESRKVLRSMLGLSKEAKLPSHEYASTRTHLIDIDQDCFDALMTSLDTNDLQQIAKDFALANRQGLLPDRVFNFINERLTQETNSFLKDAMSMDIDIDDFIEDITPLFDELNTNYDAKYIKLLKEAASLILARAVQLHRTVEEDGEVVFSINDSFVNLQTGWVLADLTDSKLNSEAQLVSSYTHQALIDAIKGMYKRASEAERILSRFRVVTLDGAYLEFFKGVLVQSAFMFKRVA
ncbi:hypothetical protein [Pseudomonas phage D6]|nr:hypothetical protein [Pseudomonas phage D6]